MKNSILSLVIAMPLICFCALASFCGLGLNGERPYFTRVARIESHVDALHPLVSAYAIHILCTVDGDLNRVKAIEKLVRREISYTNETPDHDLTLDEILEQKRGNCVAQAVLACSICQSLGIQAHIKACCDHAWIVATINGQPVEFLTL